MNDAQHGKQTNCQRLGQEVQDHAPQRGSKARQNDDHQNLPQLPVVPDGVAHHVEQTDGDDDLHEVAQSILGYLRVGGSGDERREGQQNEDQDRQIKRSGDEAPLRAGENPSQPHAEDCQKGNVEERGVETYAERNGAERQQADHRHEDEKADLGAPEHGQTNAQACKDGQHDQRMDEGEEQASQGAQDQARTDEREANGPAPSQYSRAHGQSQAVQHTS